MLFHIFLHIVFFLVLPLFILYIVVVPTPYFFARIGKEIEELINIYRDKELKLIKQQIQIENAIENLDDPTDRNIIRLKYIDGHTWERICVILNYSWNGIHKKHRKILEKIG